MFISPDNTNPERANLADWADVATYLNFRNTYTTGNKFALSPEELIDAYINRDSVHSGKSLRVEIVEGRMNVVDSAVLLTKSENMEIDLSWQLDAGRPDVFVYNIWKAFSLLPKFLKDEEKQNTQLHQLLKDHPEIVDILNYMGTGNSLRSYLDWLPVPMSYDYIENTKGNIIRDIVFGKEMSNGTPIWISTNPAIQKFLMTRNDYFGLNAVNKFNGSIKSIIEPEGCSSAITGSQVNRIRVFLKAAMVLHYTQAVAEGKRYTDLIKLFPLTEFTHLNAHTIDYVQYYRRAARLNVCPDSILFFMRSILETSSREKATAMLMSELKYQESAVKSIFSDGTRFLENILFSRNSKLSLEELTTNQRHKNIALIFKLLRENFNWKSYLR